jgi:tetratricopeptide (TPR) repeat protein
MRTNGLKIVELCLLLMLAACSRRVAVGPPPRVPVPAPPPPSLVALGEADRAFAAKDYDDACRAYEDYLRLAPANEPQDQVLFRLGMAYTLRKAGADWPRAQGIWKRLIAEYPNSVLKPPVELILTLYSEVSQVNADVKLRDDRIRQLSTELDRLKKIDSERRKTP